MFVGTSVTFALGYNRNPWSRLTQYELMLQLRIFIVSVNSKPVPAVNPA